ncbi:MULTISPECIES: AraC family transcriptional regulator [Herbaspirillum]|nr:AraC-like DNA-binding protein [Herbaspirillum sp. 1130]MDR6741384.1 AraC-like DNA-binding protein [Herbaspirillum sp. 1173]
MMNVLHSDPSTGRMPMPASVERLLNGSNKLLFASSDLDEVRSMVGRVMKPHRLDLTGQGERLDARMHYTSLGDLSVSRLRYGSAVQIEPGSLDSFFLVQMPLYGMARIESGAQHIDSSAELASVLSPQEATRMTWMAGTDQLMLRLSRSLVERTLVGYLGHPLNEPLRFELGFRWRECAPWQCMLSYLIDCTLQHPDLAMHKIVVSQIEQLAASILVTSHRHNHCEDAPARRSTILPRHVRRAQDFLEAHAHEPVTAEQLAQAAGVSVRSLYAGFKDFLGVSPMQYLRDLRMERARAELMSGDSNHVAGVALRWGFAHMGRFSNEYKQRYGESPSKTLRAR